MGLSGGVDSSVAAYLVKQQGYEVVGLFMRNWTDTTGLRGEACPWHDDMFDAEALARKLGIPFHFVDLSEEYRHRVADYMFAEYAAGRTPNPDILCNREIKFDSFARAASDIGCDFLATGHYCRISHAYDPEGHPIHSLLAGRDPGKDQSYFLCQLRQEQLANVMFPVGDMLKSEVRRVAAEADLPTARKKDSQGICFVGKVDLPTFLQQQLRPAPGDVILVQPDDPMFARDWTPAYSSEPDFEDLLRLSLPYPFAQARGRIIGQHQGAQFLTIGQRKGVCIGGFPEPLFVVGTDIAQRRVYVGMGLQHPALFRRVVRLAANELHWVRPDLALRPGEQWRGLCRIRYRQPLQQATAWRTNDSLYIVFDQPQRGVAAGQFAALYNADEVIASGVMG